jgi:hypothetical protein
MIGFKTSTSFTDKLNRLKESKKHVKFTTESMLKREAIFFIKIFQDGIKNKQFGLQKLSQSTVTSKQRQGMQYPDTPLYGEGLDIDKRTYINALRIRKLKQGYNVYVSKAMHHSANKPLDYLFAIHELGCTIVRGNTATVIPPRPAFKKTQIIFTNKVLRLRESEYREIRLALKNFVRNKQIDGFTRIIRSIPDIKKYED